MGAMLPVDIERLTRSPRAANWGYFSITVDSVQVGDMLAAALQAISGPSLLVFLEEMASEYFTEEIIDRFAFEGDDASGDWAPLEESTQRIREALGYSGDHPINERTQELLNFVAFHRDFMSGPQSAVMSVPGEPNSQSIEAKLRTAQQGSINNPMFPGAVTPPRPVLAYNAGDMANLLKLLELYLMQRIGGLL